MALTAREVVFYIRAEDQASRVIKRAAASFGSLRSAQQIQQQGLAQQLAFAKKISAARDKLANQDIINANRVAAAENRLAEQRIAAARKVEAAQLSIRNKATQITAATTALAGIPQHMPTSFIGAPLIENPQFAVAAEKLATLHKEMELLQGDLVDIERLSNAAGAALEHDFAAAQAEAVRLSTAIRETQTELTRLALEASAANDKLLFENAIARQKQLISTVQGTARAFRLMGIVALAALGYAAHAAASFQTEVALAATQNRRPGASAASTLPAQKSIQADILKQMQQFPATAKEMADSFYQIFSGTNIQGVKQAAADVSLFNKAAVAGQVSLEDMTNAGILLNNVFGIGKGPSKEFKNMTEALNAFFAAVRYGKTTASQLAQSLGYISPIAKDVHLSFKNVSEDLAFFTRQTGGHMTRQDAQGLARLIQLLGRQDVTSGLAAKGIPVWDKLTGKMRPVVEILKDIHDKLKLTPQETLNFFKTISAAGSGKGGTQGTIQAIRIFAQGIANAKEYQKVVHDVAHDQGEFQKSFDVLSKTPGVQWKVFLNQIKAITIIIGTQAIPAFSKLGAVVFKAFKYFNSLSDSTKHDIGYWGTIASVVAIVGGTFVVLIGSVGKLILTMRLLRLPVLAAEAGSASLTVGVFGAALVALVVILARYPGILHSVTSALGGVHGILIALTIAAAAFTLIKVITSITSTGVAAEVATGRVDTLRKSLLRLGLIAIPAIVVPVIYHVSKELGSADKPGQYKLTYHGVLGQTVGRTIVAGVVAVDKAHGMSPAAIRADVLKEATKAGGIPGVHVVPNSAPKDVQKLLGVIAEANSMGLLDDGTYNAAFAAFRRGDYNKVRSIANKIGNFYRGQGAIGNRRNYIPPTAVQAATSGSPGGTAAYMKQLKNVARLQTVFDADKTPDFNKYKAYTNALNAINKKYNSDLLKGYTSDYLSKVQSADKKSLSDAAKAAAKLDKDQKAELNARLKAVKKLKEVFEKSHSLADHTKYYAALTQLNKDYASKASQDYIHGYLDKVNAADKKRLELQKKNAANAKTQIKDLVSGIQSIYDNYLQQNQSNFGSLFSGPFSQSVRIQDMQQFGYKLTGKDELHDIKSQLFQFNRFNKQLDALGARGAPKSLIDQLRTMGPSAKNNIKALQNLSPAQWAEYVKAWKSSQNAIKVATQTQLDSQLKIYERHGRKIASAIIRGIQSENVKLTDAIQNTVIKMFPSLAKQAHFHAQGSGINGSPSSIGKNIVSNIHQPKKVADKIEIHMHGKPSAEDKAAVKHMVFKLQNGWFS